MALITVLGDVHGKTDQYQKILRQRFAGQRTVQLGDMGLGFKGVPGLHAAIMGDNHKFIRGNHDDPAKCRLAPGYLGDFGYLEEDKLFFLGGAFSIDRDWRVSGVTWWEDEELSYQQLQEAVDLYAETKPRFVISHEAPSEAAKHLLMSLLIGYRSEKLACSMSRTAEALQGMFEIHQPEIWCFGHYHVDNQFELKGTTFRCIDELHTYQIETGTNESK